jgi:hemolysin D
MEDRDTNTRSDEQFGMFEVTPVDSPSANFLVTEHLQRIPNIFSRGLVYLIVLILATALIYSTFGKLDIVVECRAVARPASHIIRMVSDRSGYIEQIFISEGQTVRKNDPLFLIRSKEALTYHSKVKDLREAIPLKREYLDTKISSIQTELNQLRSNLENIIRVNKLKLEQNNLSLDTISSDLNFWESEIKLLTTDFQNAEKLLQKEVISIREYNYTKSKLEKARSEVEKLASGKAITLKERTIIEGQTNKEIADLANSEMILQKEIKNLELEKQTALNTMRNELEMNEKMLSMQDGSTPGSDTAGRNEKMVMAENAGTISELYFRNTGAYVRESDLLCTIVPHDSPLYMDIVVANKDIGFIEKDMAIKYKVDAFPYFDYGILEGRVWAIAPSAVEDQMLGMVYHVHGSLSEPFFEITGKRYPLKAGMTSIAELITERKSMFSLIFSKFK